MISEELAAQLENQAPDVSPEFGLCGTWLLTLLTRSCNVCTSGPTFMSISCSLVISLQGTTFIVLGRIALES